MWRPTMLLLGLIAALSGTPLRQAEAATDFARSWVERGPGHVEEIDDGVGDDAEVAVRDDGGCDLSFAAMMPPMLADAVPMPPLPLRIAAGIVRHSPRDPVAPLSPGSARGRAWLQCFLF